MSSPLKRGPSPSKEDEAPRKKPRKKTAEASPGSAAKSKHERAMDPVRVHIKDRLESAARLAHGTLQMPQTLADAMTIAEPIHVPAPRFEQNHRTLLPPHVRPLIHLLGDARLWHEQPAEDVLKYLHAPDLFGAVARMQHNEKLTDLPPHVAEAVSVKLGITGASNPDAVPTGSTIAPVQWLKPPNGKRDGGAHPVRLVDAAIGNLRSQPKQQGDGDDIIMDEDDETPLKGDKLKKHQYHEERKAHFAAYYASDPVPDPELPFGMKPSDYPSMRAILNESLESWNGRHELHNQAAEGMPRISVEMNDMAFLAESRKPPNPLYLERPCCLGEHCIVHVLARSEGRPAFRYNPKEYKTPSEQKKWRDRRAAGLPITEADDGKQGMCWDDLRYAWTTRSLMGLMHKEAPQHGINTAEVSIGKGGYARDVLMPEKVDGVKTCIAGSLFLFCWFYIRVILIVFLMLN